MSPLACIRTPSKLCDAAASSGWLCKFVATLPFLEQMGMDAGPHGGPSSDINVTPLVDICLVLLIILMVMTPKNVSEVSVRVPPQSTGSRDDVPRNTFMIGLSKDGGILVNNVPVQGRPKRRGRDLDACAGSRDKATCKRISRRSVPSF